MSESPNQDNSDGNGRKSRFPKTSGSPSSDESSPKKSGSSSAQHSMSDTGSTTCTETSKTQDGSQEQSSHKTQCSSGTLSVQSTQSPRAETSGMPQEESTAPDLGIFASEASTSADVNITVGTTPRDVITSERKQTDQSESTPEKVQLPPATGQSPMEASPAATDDQSPREIHFQRFMSHLKTSSSATATRSRISPTAILRFSRRQATRTSPTGQSSRTAPAAIAGSSRTSPTNRAKHPEIEPGLPRPTPVAAAAANPPSGTAMLAHIPECSFISIPTSPAPKASLVGFSTPHPMYRSLGLLCSTPRYPEDELRALAANDRKLHLAGYYHGFVTWAEAARLLSSTPIGTFLVRDSEHSHYLYALSVQTRQGPTSCRIDYRDGCFRLDSAGRIAERMPRFDCVTDLVDHYVELTEFVRDKGSLPLTHVWLDLNERNTRDAPVQLNRPLYKRVPSLEHLCIMKVVTRIKKRYGRTLCKVSVNNDADYRTLPRVFQRYALDYLFPAESEA